MVDNNVVSAYSDSAFRKNKVLLNMHRFHELVSREGYSAGSWENNVSQEMFWYTDTKPYE